MSHLIHLPAKAEVSLRCRSLNMLLVIWCTDNVLTPPTISMEDRSIQLQTSSTSLTSSRSLLSGWTPNTLATRLSGTGAWAQAARRTNTYTSKRSKVCKHTSMKKQNTPTNMQFELFMCQTMNLVHTVQHYSRWWAKKKCDNETRSERMAPNHCYPDCCPLEHFHLDCVLQLGIEHPFFVSNQNW